MRRLVSLGLVLSLVASACGDDGSVTGGGDDKGSGGSDVGSVGKDGGTIKKDGGGGSSSGNKDGGGGGGPSKDLTPTSTAFTADRTGDANLPSGTVDKLKAGGASCDIHVLYPYDKTVFPAGLTPPTVMWDSNADAVYVKLAYDGLDTLDYQTAAGASNGTFTFSQDDWDQIVRRTQPQTSLLITFTTMSGGAVSTCNLTWKVAQGAMVGAVYYNTYDSPESAGKGAVVRLTLGQPQSEVYLTYQGNSNASGPCISCHSVSANGSWLAASQHNYNPFQWDFQASSYQVTSNPQPTAAGALSESTFAGFTPDGTRLLSIGQPDCTNGSNSFPRSPNNFPLVKGPATAGLVDTASGNPVAAKGLDPGWYMWMPQFSPSGDKVVFNHAKMGPDGRTDRRELAVMDFDSTSNTFSNLKVIVSNQGPAPSMDYSPMPIAGALDVPNAGNNCNTNTPSDVGAIPGGSCSGPCYPAWPFFTPDGLGVVYSLVSEPDFMSAFPGRDTPSKSELWYVDIQTNTAVRLDTANKGLADGDATANYYPTMLPVQIGGYFWMFWTSTRNWGSHDFSQDSGGGGGAGGIITNIFGGMSSANAIKKRIWVSAIRPRAQTEAGLEPIADTSAPGFYLEGQSDTGNVRAFATLNPCRQDGSDCTSGLDCCSGYCDIKDGADTGSCVPMKTCSDLYEKCKTDADCCPAAGGAPPNTCVGNYCAFPIL